MSSEVVTFNDLGKILKLAGQSPSGYIHMDVPAAYMYGSSTTNIAVTNQSYYALNSFGGYAATHGVTNNNYFAPDTNGFKILREGVYRLALQVHFNAAASGVVFSTQFYNYTQAKQLGIPQYISDDSKGYASTDNEWIGLIGENEIVIPRFSRYAGSANMRPTTFVYSITLLHDPNAAELFQGGSSSGEVTDATATPTPDKVSKFDNNAFMNSEDMSSSDVEDFIEDLDVSGGGSGGGGIPNVDDFTSEEVDEFVNSLNIGEVRLINHIVDEGTNGTWHYRVWSNGKKEVWLKASLGTLTFTKAAYRYYLSYTYAISPPVSFTTINTIQANACSSTTSIKFENVDYLTSTQKLRGYFMGDSSDSGTGTRDCENIYLYAYIVGE